MIQHKDIWQGQDNEGNPINIIFYGYWFWVTHSYWMIPGAEVEDDA